MPRYDYRCQQCGNVYEKREGFDAPSLQTCPDCSGTARRILTPPAIVFKGSGWYSTDNRKSANGAHGDTAAKSDDKGDATGEPKAAETKAESKSEPSSGGGEPAPKPEKTAKAAAD